jgi:hypothetical protein
MYGAGPLVEQGGGLWLQIFWIPSFSITMMMTWSKMVPVNDPAAGWIIVEACGLLGFALIPRYPG